LYPTSKAAKPLFYPNRKIVRHGLKVFAVYKTGKVFMAKLNHSFPPIISKNSQTLILGSLPGEESLRRQQYYAHKRNVFWKLIYAAFDEEFNDNYTQRCKFILGHGLALWDVCGSAVRVGSADSKITDVTPNGITALLVGYPNITRILLNGRKAESEYKRHFKNIQIPAIYVPSTSPAFASLSFEEKLCEWKKHIKA
jgi:hypoxanthine-DNA glycosylase